MASMALHKDKRNYMIYQHFVRQARVKGQSTCSRSRCPNLQLALEGPASTRASSCRAQEYEECMRIIEKVLRDTENLCEYALYVKGLILRQKGAGVWRAPWPGGPHTVPVAHPNAWQSTGACGAEAIVEHHYPGAPPPPWLPGVVVRALAMGLGVPPKKEVTWNP